MERTYWQAWEKFLNEYGLKPIVSGLLVEARSLVILFSQVMVVGLPLVASTSWRRGYEAMITTFSSGDRLDAFSAFLREAEG